MQFDPKLGDFDGNVQHADDILSKATASSLVASPNSPAGIESLKPELLVLPELAFTGMLLSDPDDEGLRSGIRGAQITLPTLDCGAECMHVWHANLAYRLQLPLIGSN